MSTSHDQILRRPPRVTYAHKKGRVSATPSLSSPLQDLDARAVIPTAEMTRRMLKRSRQGDSFSSRDQEQDSEKQQERSTKRSKHSSESNAAINLHLFHPYTSDVFQTPYVEDYIHPSAITKPLVPEDMSPLPIANRILSRASSRNSKENGPSSTSSRHTSRKGLASPFSSRHNSASSSPRSRSRRKVKPKSRSKATRPALARSNSSNTSQHPSFHREPTFIMNQDIQEPSIATKSIALNRYPSSHTLTQNPRQDWLIPPKALKKKSPVHTPPHYGTYISSSDFLSDFPMAFSTPLPSQDQFPPAFAIQKSPENGNTSFYTTLDDVTMAPISNPTSQSPHRNNTDSIFSLSVAPETESSAPFVDSLFEPMSIQLEPNHEITFHNQVPMDDAETFENESENTLNNLFDELVLDPADEGIRINLKSTFPHPTRAKSLNSDASVLFFPLPPAGTSGRKRAGTIRASDYQQATTTTTTTTTHAHARRTRSGTVVGPTAMNAIKEPTPIVSRKKPTPVPMEESGSESDDELVLKASGWKDEDFEYLGLPNPNPNAAFNNRALPLLAGYDSDDELLLKDGQSEY